MKKILFLLLSLSIFFICVRVFAFNELGTSSVNITYTDGTNDYKSIRVDYYITSNDNKIFVSGEEIITDAGRFNNHADVVKISKRYDFDLNELYNEGYRTAAIEIRMDLKEIDDGYQHIFIYDNLNSAKLLLGATFEHGSGFRNDTLAKYYFYLELNLLDILDGDFTVHYDASGKGNDDWQNNNVEYQLGFSKEWRKTDYIWITNSKTGSSNIIWERLDKKS